MKSASPQMSMNSKGVVQAEGGVDENTAEVEESASPPKIHGGNWLNSILQGIIKTWFGFKNLFQFPIVPKQISYFRPEDHTPTGERDFTKFGPEQASQTEALERKVNFRDDLLDRVRMIIDQRSKAQEIRNGDLDELKFEEWKDRMNFPLFFLKSTFQIFDRGGDGFIDFDEFTKTLDEFGDETESSERHSYFSSIDSNGYGSIDFEQFLQLMYYAQIKSESTLDTSLQEILGNISRNQSLDVVQQLQAGLF